ncbi:MAG: hypothetical protein CMH58_02460 [Myxococcales bacterium]|nr:hypothetical protein [Myxococcales bacterium]
MAGTGGRLKADPEHFVVHEIPAFLPTGEGNHLWLEVEKVNLSTPQLLRSVAQRTGVNLRSVGSAGRKDKRAVTRQWLSLERDHADALPADGEWLEVESGSWQILQRNFHDRRLRTGALRGNRFQILISELQPDALLQARQLNRELQASEWMPNPYGQQRFNRPESLVRARQFLERGFRGRNHKDRFDYSVLQSAFFNHYLRLRRWPEPLIVAGEWYQTHRGGIFTDPDEVLVSNRLKNLEIYPCGPLPGGKLRSPGAQAQLWMDQVGEILGTGTEKWRGLGKKIPGAWRPVAIPAPAVEIVEDSLGIWFHFDLPAGSYATVLIDYFQTGKWTVPCPV